MTMINQKRLEIAIILNKVLLVSRKWDLYWTCFCGLIGWLFKTLLGYFSCKISPNIAGHDGLFRKLSTLGDNCFGNIFENYGLFYSNIWSHWHFIRSLRLGDQRPVKINGSLFSTGRYVTVKHIFDKIVKKCWYRYLCIQGLNLSFWIGRDKWP